MVADFELAAGSGRLPGLLEPLSGTTDDLAAPAYDSLTPSELDQLIADLEPISAALDAAGSRSGTGT